MKRKNSKKVSETQVTMTQLVLPTHTNALGTIFGGTMVSWIDIAAAIVANRHAQKTVVTASIDALHFLAPARQGDVVTIRASVNATGRTSMEIGVRVDSENPNTGEKWHTASAYLTFVALDSRGKPSEVPAVIPVTPEEKRRNKEAMIRRKLRMQLAEQIKSQKRT